MPGSISLPAVSSRALPAASGHQGEALLRTPLCSPPYLLPSPMLYDGGHWREDLLRTPLCSPPVRCHVPAASRQPQGALGQGSGLRCCVLKLLRLADGQRPPAHTGIHG